MKIQFITLFIAVVLVACHNENTKEKECYASYELVGPGGEQVNLVDCDKRKQGRWIPSPTNDLKDTVFYRNDTVISHLH